MATDVGKSEGKILNNEILALFKNRIDAIINDPEAQQLAQVNTDEVREIMPGVYIKRENEEEYSDLQELLAFLSFDETLDNEIYDIPGVEIGLGNDAKKVRIAVKKDNITRIADKAADFERRFASTLGLKFPSEIYQLQSRYINENLPGKDFPAPEPKLVSEQPQDYERRIEEYYNSHNVNKEMDEAGQIRKPYIHETIDYRQDNAIVDGYASDSYTAHMADAQNQRMNNTPRRRGTNQRLTQGNRQRITASELVEENDLGSNFGNGLKSWKHMIFNGDNKRHLGYAIGAVAGGAAIIALLASNPALAGGLGVVAVAGGIGVLGVKPMLALRKKIKDLIYGKQIEQAPEEEEEEQTLNPPTANPPTQNPPTENPPTQNPPTANPPRRRRPTPPSGNSNPSGQNGGSQGANQNGDFGAEDFLYDVNLDLNTLESAIQRAAAIQEQMAGLDQNSTEYHNLAQDLRASLETQKRVVANLAAQYNGLHEELNIGGRNR